MKWPVDSLVDAAGGKLEELLVFQAELDRIDAEDSKREAERLKNGNGT